jgi:hypothetical protein
MAEVTEPADIAVMSFEEALIELEQIVRRQRVDRIVIGPDGAISAEPAQLD